MIELNEKKSDLFNESVDASVVAFELGHDQSLEQKKVN